MKYYQKIICPKCKQTDPAKVGKSTHGIQRYRCLNSDCDKKTFMLDYLYKACESGTKKKRLKMTINASGIRDIGRVLKVARSTVIRTIKKKAGDLVYTHPNFDDSQLTTKREISFKPFYIEVEADEQWSFVKNKSNQIKGGFGLR